ncbi:MAG: Nif11-like leader peptide family natural product precursor [Cyanobacteriota bacterium]|jgi:predicted ribosomally synthesized peptide with nif11-like leader
MSLASLEAFLERAHGDEGLRELLSVAPDAASVAAIARAAGFPVSELDLWRASGASPDELQPSSAGASSTADAPTADSAAAAVATPVGREAALLPDPWLETDDPLTRFVHQAHGDEELQRALASAPDAAAVASIAQAAGYPISEVDLWLASGVTPEDVAADQAAIADGAADMAEDRAVEEVVAGKEPPLSPEAALPPLSPEAALPPLSPEAALPTLASDDLEDAIGRFLRQAEGDQALQAALANAPDAAAVAAIAQGAGHPVSELALWLASGAGFEEGRPEPEIPTRGDDPLGGFLRAVEVDPDLQIALASAPDAATVAAIARIAGFPITTADLWAASDADPWELMGEGVVMEEMVVMLDG